MELSIVISFVLASVFLALMPGPDNIFVLTESLTKGKYNGIAISVGLSLGVIFHTILAATGITILIQESAMAFSLIKYLGAAYLFYLAYKATQEKRQIIELVTTTNDSNNYFLPLVKKGFLMNILNPKVSLFFIAFLPQFLTKDGFNVTLQMIILGFIFMIQAFVVFSTIAILASKLTRFVNSPKFWKITKWSKVTILIILGVVLLLSQK
mgnify:CR=1 FL=1